MAKKVLMALELTDSELSILFANDTQMQGLNREYRNKDKTTDVLAFSMSDGQYPHINPAILGDIVISLPTARRQAKEKGRGIYEEIAVLLVHGILHLIGYDHEKGEKEELRMKRKERELLNHCKQDKTPSPYPSPTRGEGI
ncbi:MAG: rRNA maturation RNase YbeY [Nitrospirae bacterium]|nr:rRNA maturation RNase YbeY [Nitrospirota bacterium]